MSPSRSLASPSSPFIARRAARPRRTAWTACIAGLLGAASAQAGTLSAFSGVVGGFGSGSIPAGCTTYGHPADLDFFGSDGAGLQVLGGNAACGYSGGWTNMTSTGTTAPLLNSASLAPTLLGNAGYAESFDGTAASRASYGSLSATAHGEYTGSPQSYAPTTIAASVGAATFSDTLTASVSNSYTDVSSSGFVRYRFAIDGIMSTPGPHYAYYGGEAHTAFDIQQNGGPIYGLLLADTTTESIGSLYVAGSSAGWTIAPGSIKGGGVVTSQMFSIDLLSSWSFTAGLIVNAYGNADDDFYSTAKLVGVDLFDANGNAITDYSLASSSGTSYPAPVVAAVPEPETLPLMLAGLVGGIAWCARRAPRQRRRSRLSSRHRHELLRPLAGVDLAGVEVAGRVDRHVVHPVELAGIAAGARPSVKTRLPLSRISVSTWLLRPSAR